MLPEELSEYIESLQYLREKYRDQIDIKIGLECEYFPEYIPWLKEQIKKYQLNYILFGNHHFHTDEKFPYFGHHTNNRDMLGLYEESAIEGMESGLDNCLAHPDLFMRSYPKFDHHCATISRHICRTAARLNIPLEYNIGYVAYNEEHGITPTTIQKSVRELISVSKKVAKEEMNFKKDPESMNRDELTKLIADIQKKMQKAAADLNFEAAAEYRDKMVELKGMLRDM